MSDVRVHDVRVHDDRVVVHDVCVAGGGAAGAACAALLARRGLDVAVIDRPAPAARDRRELLSPSALRLLAGLDLDLPLLRTPAACRGVLSRWAADAPAFFDYELCDCGAGAIVSRSGFAHALLDLAVAAGASVIATRPRPGATPTPPRYLVDATGRSGRVMPHAFPRRHTDRAVCVWTRDAPALRHADVLILDRTPNGWWYAISSSESTSDIAFVTDADCLPAPHLRPRFLEAEYREARLLADDVLDEPSFAATHSTDARAGHRGTMAGDGWLAVGDAAIALDPLSGNGIRVALEGAARAADAIERMVRAGSNDGVSVYLAWCADTIERERHVRQEVYRSARRTSSDGVFWQRR